MGQKLISFDWAIKRLLRDKAHFGILSGFLSDLLGFKIQVTDILESETNKDGKKDKGSRLDLIAKNRSRELIIIEVQVEPEPDFPSRLLFGVSKTLTDFLKSGQEYSKIKKIYSIGIVYFNLGEGNDYIYRGKFHFTGDHVKEDLHLSKFQKERLYKHYPNREVIGDLFPEYIIVKVEKFNNNVKKPLDEWVYLLKNQEIKGKYKSKPLQEAEKSFSVLKMSKQEKEEYNQYQKERAISLSGMQEKFFEGLLEGEAKGEAKARLDIAKNLLAQGFTKKQVLSIAGVTSEELSKIQ